MSGRRKKKFIHSFLCAPADESIVDRCRSLVISKKSLNDPHYSVAAVFDVDTDLMMLCDDYGYVTVLLVQSV